MNQQRQIPEADWKLWRRLRERALERYCQTALNEFAEFKDGEGSAHQRYLKLYQLVQRRDQELGEIFDGPKRSNAFFQITFAVQAGLVSPDELALLSEETRSVIGFLSGHDR